MDDGLRVEYVEEVLMGVCGVVEGDRVLVEEEETFVEMRLRVLGGWRLDEVE